MFASLAPLRPGRRGAEPIHVEAPALPQAGRRGETPQRQVPQALNDDVAPAVDRRASRRRAVESTLIVVGMSASLGLFAAFLLHHLGISARPGGGVYFYYAMVGALLYCSLAYQLNRFGTSRRRPLHTGSRPPQPFAGKPSATRSVTILIPSYREERRVLLATVLSAAMAEHANRRIVVLVDDPPSDAEALACTMGAIRDSRRWMADQSERFGAEAAAWRARSALAPFAPREEARRLAAAYQSAADALNDLAARIEAESEPEFRHVDGFVANRVVRELAARCRRRAYDVAGRTLSHAETDAAYRRLASLFCADISTFQRKSFDDLSHAPNKAMNLNAYIGLMGARWTVVEENGRRRLERAAGGACDLDVPRPDFVLTLDADSVVMNDYVATLARVLEDDPRAAVAQTPYLTFPHGPSPVERIAGATTDIQYLVHQGSSWFDAAYWVGANALIRFEALEQIATTQVEDGKTVKVFIQDCTVIEDTGSTIDLLRKGWRVHNHFEPLAYSATPADFGALAIQRRRWANGGLIILPELLREYAAAGRRLRRLPELLLRAHYLLSPVIGNVAVFSLMVWSSRDARSVMWTPLIMLPYFLLYGSDLKRLGYRVRDLFGVCALNLMLLPVNFAGIGASVRQLLTGRKGSFTRTPKVANRTFIPPYAFLFNLGIFVLMAHYATKALASAQYAGAVIPIVNMMLYAYGIVRFIGLRDGLSDLLLALRARLRTLTALAASAPRLPRVPRPARAMLRHAAAAVLAALLVLAVPGSRGSHSQDAAPAARSAGAAAVAPAASSLAQKRPRPAPEPRRNSP